MLNHIQFLQVNKRCCDVERHAIFSCRVLRIVVCLFSSLFDEASFSSSLSLT